MNDGGFQPLVKALVIPLISLFSRSVILIAEGGVGRITGIRSRRMGVVGFGLVGADYI